MLDYVPMEIVAYAEEETPTFDEVYPHLIDNWGVNLQDYAAKTFYNWAPTNYTYESGMDLDTDTIPNIVGAQIVAVQMYRYMGTYYNEYETCFYASANDNLYRITQADVNQLKGQGMEDPWATPTAPPAFNGNNILEWLYDFGKNLIQDNGLINVLSYDIGGYNILSFLTANGFIIVMGWIIIKFVIP